MSKKRRLPLGVIGALLVTAAMCALIYSAGNQMLREEMEVLRRRVRTAAISCYAAEGRYPLSLSYLEEAYGLRYDKTRFSVYYDAFASNVPPDIDVYMNKGAGMR